MLSRIIDVAVFENEASSWIFEIAVNLDTATKGAKIDCTAIYTMTSNWLLLISQPRASWPKTLPPKDASTLGETAHFLAHPPDDSPIVIP